MQLLLSLQQQQEIRSRSMTLLLCRLRNLRNRPENALFLGLQLVHEQQEIRSHSMTLLLYRLRNLRNRPENAQHLRLYETALTPLPMRV